MKKITELKNLKLSFDLPDEAIAFLESLDERVENGKYTFGEDCFVNVMDAETSLAFAPMEAHQSYVDVQVQINGEERIYYADIEMLTLKTPYDAERDCAFYNYEDGIPFVDFCKGEAVVLYPNDAHLPCRAPTVPMKTKKAVMKIRYPQTVEKE